MVLSGRIVDGQPDGTLLVEQSHTRGVFAENVEFDQDDDCHILSMDVDPVHVGDVGDDGRANECDANQNNKGVRG